jgi:wobble nucleotide-excising tRNase
MTIIKNIRILKGAPILADRKASTPTLDLKRFNLFYGFNGSGKSTLSRIFACLQHGTRHNKLPDDCTFEIEMSDGRKFTCPDALSGIEQRVCVFNSDFVVDNLRWETGVANPVFYISAEQGDAAEQLKAIEAKLPAAQKELEGETKLVKERERSFTDYKKNLAKTISERLRQASRYEAPQLIVDIEKLGATATNKLSAADLDAATATCARSEPPAKVKPVGIAVSSLRETFEAARKLASQSVGEFVVANLEAHPLMVPWAKQGHDYHIGQSLESCLYCGEKISDQRKQLLTAAFDDQLNRFIVELNTAVHHASHCAEGLAITEAAIPAAAQLSAEFQPAFKSAASTLNAALKEVKPILMTALNSLRERKAAPTRTVDVSLLPREELEALLKKLESACEALNAICKQHSDMVDDFTAHQTKAREAIRRHYIASNGEDFKKHSGEVSDATAEEANCKATVTQLQDDIVALRTKVQQHGPAADKINALVKSYLGHSELTIVAVKEGYELHRHGALVTGAPSEGEKTAIAICYFLSTLEAEDRKVKNLIVVVDDPVSSLDTKAMNYACGLIRNRLSDASQLILLTHNQHCMNEFKKSWKGWARAKPATASLKFIDVSIRSTSMVRTANIIDLPKHFRDYESEYHFLFEKVMALEAANGSQFDYAFMMPNVLRRVLEIFLAFKVPRDGNLADKIKTLCERHNGLDQNRLNALERLSQVESHSDNLDDLIAQSSMTIEESVDANTALIHLMDIVDPAHLTDLRKYCAP